MMSIYRVDLKARFAQNSMIGTVDSTEQLKEPSCLGYIYIYREQV